MPVEISLPNDFVLADASRTLSAWTELMENLEETPLFPIQTLADILQLLVPLWSKRAEWRKLLDLADEAIGKRSGRHVIAARARDRAVTLLDDHRYLDALEEFHRAKYEWWSGETVRGSLLAMIIIAKLCLELRLPQASKSYALAVSYIAALRREEEIEDLIPTGLLVAASADFIAGAWSSAAEMYELGLTTQYELIGDGTDWEKHKELQNAYLHLAYINACARAVDRQRQSLRNLIEAIPEDAWTQQSNAIGSRQYSQFGGAQRKAVSLLRGFCVGSSRAIGFSSFFSSAATESCHLMWRITCRYHALETRTETPILPKPSFS